MEQSDGATPLFVACVRGDVNTVMALLEDRPGGPACVAANVNQARVSGAEGGEVMSPRVISCGGRVGVVCSNSVVDVVAEHCFADQRIHAAACCLCRRSC